MSTSPRAGGALSTRLRIEQPCDAPIVRAVTLRRGLSAGLDRVRANEAAMVASELATNIATSGQGGEILLDVDLASSTFWIVALDRGPGLPSLDDYFQDRISRIVPRARDAAGEDGSSVGVRSVRRLSDEVRWEPRDGGGSKISCVISLRPGGGSQQ